MPRPRSELVELAADTAIARHEIMSQLRPGTGACAGLFQSRAVPIGSTAPCTHGPDSWIPDRDGHVGVPAGARTQPLPQFASLPGIPCYSSGARVHVFYAFFEKNLLDAPGVQNRRAAILNAVAVADRILNVSAGQSGGVRHIRWVMNQCHLVITPLKVASKFTFEAFDPTYLRYKLERAHLMSSSEKGLTFLETATAPIPAGCQGIGELWYDDRDIPANLNNDGDMNTLVVTGCTDPLFDRFAAGEVSIHELFHSMGAVQHSAPHHTNSSHCWDETDVMCYDDDGRPGTFRLRQVCPVTVPELLDCKDNDYFDTSPAGGTYLATHWDAAGNTFQATGAPARFQPLPAPKIALKSPGTSVSGRVTVPLTVLAPGGGIVQVIFTVNGQKTLDRSAPYAVTINTAGKPNGARITVGAVATDRFGLEANAKTIAMTVRNPIVTLSTPTSFRSIGQHFAWSAKAAPSPGHTIQKVELVASYTDGTSTVLDTDASAPFGGTVDSLPKPDRFARTLRARATQSGGDAVISPPRDVTLLTPSVQIVAPSYGVATAAPFAILAESEAAPGLSIDSIHVRVVKGFGANPPLVDQFVMSNPLSVDGPHASFTATWPRPSGPQPTPGNSYVLRFTATDSAGNAGYVGETAVTWLGGSHSTVAITAPADDSVVSGSDVAIVAQPTANGHQAQYASLTVDDGALTWSVNETTDPPWTVPNQIDDGWDTTTSGNGPHVVWATLFTDESMYSASPGTLVSVDNGNPALTLTGLSPGQEVTGSVALHAALTGTPAGWGDPYRVEFFANGRNVAYDDDPGNGIGAGWSTGAYDNGRVELRAVAHFFGSGSVQWSLWSAPLAVGVHH